MAGGKVEASLDPFHFGRSRQAPVMRVLCVAEKPSIARSITDILSGGRFETVSLVSLFVAPQLMARV